ncbi:MAG TPA: hypothetical protein PKE39_12080 [Ignavibacteria bacterium]|nr:hypothetical protein [Ignavibacteria bacterium]HMQ99753.1 hypothetical protein [Ignavibacteria bacterium]
MIRQYLILLSFISTLASCDTNNILVNKETKDVEYFHARVDALNIPDSLSLLDSLRIGILGTLGPDLCYSVSHYEVNPINEGISIKIIGKHILNTACLQAIAGYCETYNVLPEKPGYYKIKLINPENTFLLDSVRIY